MLLRNDTSVTPLEFVYEAADCRLFYTADMVRDVTNVWKKTVDGQWGDANSVCVDGSTGQESSTPTAQGQKTSAASTMGASGVLVAIAAFVMAFLML